MRSIIYIPHQMLTVLKYIALVGTFFIYTTSIYTTSGVFSKLASQREFLSPGYIAFLAYMFKGTGVVFGLLLAHFVFGEAITIFSVQTTNECCYGDATNLLIP